MERYSLNHLFRMLGCFMLCIMFTATAFAQQKTITSNPQPIGFRGNLLVKRQKFFYCTYSLGITETS